MSIKEILEELPKLTPEERQYVREWLEADEFPETEALIAAVDEGFRSSQTGKGISIEEARELVRKCAHNGHRPASYIAVAKRASASIKALV